jgi:Protein of unknown function (DUF1592)/Protein of unknown function (DUF1588)/Protein of unknown function (DUF1595)/Protein of unknown function (DUF1585)/Protein of unknown function (DUF1587)
MSKSEPTDRREVRSRSVTRRAFAHPLYVAWLLLGAAGCTAMIDGSSNGPPGSQGSTGTGTSSTGTGTTGTGSTGTGAGTGSTTLASFTCSASATPDPGPSPLGLLSRTQYLNTLNGLFTTVPDLSTELGADTNYSVTFGVGQADIDQVQVGGFQAAAETIAASVVADAKALAALAPCAAGADKRQCAQNFVQSFGALAYRSPITDAADIARHMAVYDAGAAVSDAHGIQLLIEAMLQSPRFLYRVELGTTQAVGANAIKLSPYEIAARLSYMVWDSPPDATLAAAAAGGQLATKDQVTAQLTRMLADPKGATFVRRFLEGWTQLASVDGLVKDTTLYPQWSAAGSTLPASVKAQASAFFDSILSASNGKLDALLTSPTVFVNKDLAGYYGSNTTSSSFSPMTLTNGQASGLLTLPAALSVQAKPDESWPIYRGRFVREELFCEDMPPPPPNVPKPPDVMPGVSTRERLTEHETNPSCSGCHSAMDPIGFGFEAYDAIGQFRTSDGGQPVDTSGNINGDTDVDGAFNGVVELGKKLATSSTVHDCVARQWFRFATNRLEQDADSCSMKSISDALTAAGNSLNALPQALVASDAFLYRRPIQVSQ